MKHISCILAERLPHYLGEKHAAFFAVGTSGLRIKDMIAKTQKTVSTNKEYVYKENIDISKISINTFLVLSPEERLEKSTNPRMPYAAVKKGSILRIDFQKNSDLENGTKLRDIIPHWVRKVRITDTSGNTKTGYKKGNIFVGENEKRLVVYSGFLVEIVG